jgi:hypothetical protein
VFNAVLGLFQQIRAQATLAALKSRLALSATGRGGGGGHGDRSTHQVRPHRGPRPYRPCRELRAEGGSARGPQSRSFQWRRYRDAGGLCLISKFLNMLAASLQLAWRS